MLALRDPGKWLMDLVDYENLLLRANLDSHLFEMGPDHYYRSIGDLH